MHGQELAVFTNMCMVYDNNGNVLVQDRVDSSWCGIAFPGGHVDANESFVDSVIREVFEETGLSIKSPQLCGVKQWQSPNDVRYVVLCYKTNDFSGNIISSDEGEISWVALSDLKDMNLASGMEYMLELFVNDGKSEHFVVYEDDVWKNSLK